MNRKAMLLLSVFLLLAVGGVYRFSHPMGWSRELVSLLDHAEHISGRVVWRVQQAELSERQAERVAEVIRGAKLQDNPSFAGTTEEGSFELIVDGVRVSAGFSVDTELQYSWNGERRSIRAVSDGYAQALREIARETIPEIPG